MSADDDFSLTHGDLSDDLWAGTDLPPDDEAGDAETEIEPELTLADFWAAADDDQRKQLVGSQPFQSWLAKQLANVPVTETAPSQRRVTPNVSPAALRLAQRAIALWEGNYP